MHIRIDPLFKIHLLSSYVLFVIYMFVIQMIKMYVLYVYVYLCHVALECAPSAVQNNEALQIAEGRLTHF